MSTSTSPFYMTIHKSHDTGRGGTKITKKTSLLTLDRFNSSLSLLKLSLQWHVRFAERESAAHTGRSGLCGCLMALHSASVPAGTSPQGDGMCPARRVTASEKDSAAWDGAAVERHGSNDAWRSRETNPHGPTVWTNCSCPAYRAVSHETVSHQ